VGVWQGLGRLTGLGERKEWRVCVELVVIWLVCSVVFLLRGLISLALLGLLDLRTLLACLACLACVFGCLAVFYVQKK